MSLYTPLIDRESWTGVPCDEAASAEAIAALERGDVIFLPQLRFAVHADESVLFTPAILGSSKNASFEPATGRVGGTSASGADARALQSLMHRFSDAAMSLVNELCAVYRTRIERR